MADYRSNMRNNIKQIRGKNIKNRLAALLCVSLLLIGCAKTPEEYHEAEEKEQQTATSQVLEVGILVDGSDPYAVVTYESFVRSAGDSSEPIVAELGDAREGTENQIRVLNELKERGVDILLVDVSKIGAEEVLAQWLLEQELWFLFFGTRPTADTLEATGGVYVGLTEEEAREYQAVMEADRFEESGFRGDAWQDGQELFKKVLETAVE